MESHTLTHSSLGLNGAVSKYNVRQGSEQFSAFANPSMLHGIDQTRKALCTANASGLVKNKALPNLFLGIKHSKCLASRKIDGFSLQKRSCPACLPVAVSTVPEKASIFSEDSSARWRLDDELDQLRSLQRRLQASGSLEEKMRVIDRNSRVQIAFGSIFRKPVLRLALNKFGDREIYLLKSLVAAGQEHVIDFSSAWYDEEFEEEIVSCSTVPEPMVENANKASALREAFTMITNFIEHSSNALPRIYDSTKFQHNHKLETKPKDVDSSQAQDRLHNLNEFICMLGDLEQFYDCIGGIIGYQVMALELMKASEMEGESHMFHNSKSLSPYREKHFLVPEGIDLSKSSNFAVKAAAWGLESLPQLCEIYPLGGSGDRLGLKDSCTGEALPVAMLPYCGRTLLESHVRDLQAREFLYFKVYREQLITPIAIMTSPAKQNNRRVQALCERHGWFGRGRQSFCFFEQSLVPTVAAENGHWLVEEPLKPVLKPGGHGVIWKLAHDRNVFKWLYSKGRKAAIIRQISNPVAATDVTLLALSGVGSHYRKKFGFASCQRNVGAAEGVNVLVETKTADGLWKYGVTCIEYTELEKLGIPDIPSSPNGAKAQFPANTNVLFVDLKSVERVIANGGSASLPGMIVNLNKPVVYTDHSGIKHSVYAGRVECTMQSIADSLCNEYPRRLISGQHELDTFIIYNERRKVTSSAKRRRKLHDLSLHQTPDGSFLDLMRNAFDLFASCRVHLPKMEGNHSYVDSGPPFIILFHPAMGPLWEIIRQKIRGGSIAKGSEVQLEISEFSWEDVVVDGSLLIQAQNIMGCLPPNSEILTYGKRCGKCRLKNVKIFNKGVDWSSSSNIYWQHKVDRQESLQVKLNGNAEFEAYDVELKGPYVFEVPDGHIMRVTGSSSGLSCILKPLPMLIEDPGSWHWNYKLEAEGHVHLTMIEAPCDIVHCTSLPQ